MANGKDDDRTVIHTGTEPKTPASGDPDRTQIHGTKSAQKVRAQPVVDAGHDVTKIHQPGSGSAKIDPTPIENAAPAAAPAASSGDRPLTVGWLTVIDGPGRGASREVYYGGNTIGRAPEQRIVLDFGDGTIGRLAAVIRFDHKTNAYYLVAEHSVNNVYVNDDIVLGNVQLAAHDRIQIGETTLLFVPLCGDGFSWDAEGA